MLQDRVSNPGPLTYESGALPIALRGPAAVDQPSPLVLPWFHRHSIVLALYYLFSVFPFPLTPIFRGCSILYGYAVARR